MSRSIFHSTVIALGILLILLLYVLIPYKIHTVSDTKKFTVVCTTGMITDTVKRIGGDAITVIGLMGPGVDPHLYRARESDIHTLASADIIFYNGLHLEGKMAHILEKMNAYTHSVAVSDALTPGQRLASPEFPTNFDPHIWLDVQLWICVTDYIKEVLCTHDPAHKELYCSNAATYLQELRTLDTYVRTQLAQLPPERRILVTAHDAFGYFGRAYGIQVVGLQGMSTQTEAGLHDISSLVQFIVEHKIPALFAESSIPSQAMAAVQQSAVSRGWHVTVGPTLYTDALGCPGTPANTYIGMVRHNTDEIVTALGQSDY